RQPDDPRGRDGSGRQERARRASGGRRRARLPRPESMKVEFDAEDSARLPADVPNDVFTGIGQKPQRNEGVDHAPLKSSFWWAEIVPLHRHHWRASGHGIVAILYANDEAAKMLQRIPKELP